MASPSFILRRGRDVSRENLVSTYIRAALQTLLDLDELLHTQTLDELDANGLPTIFTDGVAPKGNYSDIKVLEFVLEFVRSKLALAGKTYSGATVVTTNDYVARRGELVLVDGLIATAVELPDPKLLVNRHARVTVKLLGGVGPCVVTPDNAGTIDGAASVPLVVDGTVLEFKVLAGPEGGAQVDTTGANAGDTVVVRGVTFTFDATPDTPYEWDNTAKLAEVINTMLGDHVIASAQGVVLIVVIKTASDDYTKVNADLLADGYTVSRAGFGGDWTKIGGAALDDAGQLNVLGVGLGAEYKIV